MTAITIAEAAIELKVRKSQAIALAEEGTLTYVADGKNGKAKTVTLDSVWKAKKLSADILAETIKKASRMLQEAPADAGAKKDTGADGMSQAEVLTLLKDIRSEVRQLRGIVCQKFSIPSQGDLPGIK